METKCALLFTLWDIVDRMLVLFPPSFPQNAMETQDTEHHGHCSEHLVSFDDRTADKPFVPGATLEIVCHSVEIGNKRKEASVSANIHVGQGEAFPSPKMDGEKEVSE